MYDLYVSEACLGSRTPRNLLFCIQLNQGTMNDEPTGLMGKDAKLTYCSRCLCKPDRGGHTLYCPPLRAASDELKLLI